MRATDAAGNFDATPATSAYVVDTLPPDTTLTLFPSSPGNDNTPTFAFISEAGATFACRVDLAAFAGCSSPFTTAALTDGVHTFEVRATDGAGNTDPSPDSNTFTVDTFADTTITLAPPSPTNDNTPTFVFTSEVGATFACRVDAAPFGACSSPFTTAALADGSHTFQVRATDPLGNTDTTPASSTFTVDTLPPETTITSSPGTPTADTTPTFTFVGGTTYACRMDGGAFAPCTSPFTSTTLTNGSHTFAVRATDAAGNTDTTPDTYTFTVDTIPPDTNIFSAPGSPTTDTTPTFVFGSELGATFTCRVDAAPFTGCSSPFTTAPLAAGTHTFEVRAADFLGNIDLTPASYTFDVIILPPGSLDSTFDLDGIASATPAGTVTSMKLYGTTIYIGGQETGVMALYRFNQTNGSFAGRTTLDVIPGFTDLGSSMAVDQGTPRIYLFGTAGDGSGSPYGNHTAQRFNMAGGADLSWVNIGQVDTIGGTPYSLDRTLAGAYRSGFLYLAGSALNGSTFVPSAVLLKADDFLFNAAPGFGVGGVVSLNLGSSSRFKAVELQADNKPVLVGSGAGVTELFRLTTAGALDFSFDADGRVLAAIPIVNALTILPSGSILIAGNTPAGDVQVARYTAAGALDPLFGTAGVATVDFGSTSDQGLAMEIDSAGRILIAGSMSNGVNDDIVVARLLANGSLDSTFGTSGKVTVNLGFSERADALAIQSDDKIVVTGSHFDGVSVRVHVLRFMP